MIGVAALVRDRDYVREFFELFKTPWEWFVPGTRYTALLIADGTTEPDDQTVVIVYGATELPVDGRSGVSTYTTAELSNVQWASSVFPVYGSVAHFDGAVDSGFLVSRAGPANYHVSCGARHLWRVGYNLFDEVRHLLETGQPPEYAQTPTLELHIAVLRQVLLKSGVHFLEVLPRPFGREFACCLTHDVDFVGITRQRLDSTLFGFIVRASVGTVVDWLRGRRLIRDVAENWRALCALPFVFLRLAPDLWRPFDDYRQIEQGLPSTFFVIPFKGRPGIGPDGNVTQKRAAAYQASEIATEITAAAASGSELAVHGIDGWRDADAGRAELIELKRVAGRATVGVRMHWLYFAHHSPKHLEDAGYEYDSTWGYNDTVGFRAGTSQVFQLPGTDNLMELPLLIMDSALFWPTRMGLADDDAVTMCRHMVTLARQFGGALVINWHCRSLAPERLWRRPYEALLNELKMENRAYFATASDVVNWFRWRRSIKFSSERMSSNVLRVTIDPGGSRQIGVLRLYRPNARGSTVEDSSVSGRTRFVDVEIVDSDYARVATPGSHI